MPNIYREFGPQKKRQLRPPGGVPEPPPAPATTGLVTGGAGHYVAAQVAGSGFASAVKTSFVQLIAFVVLAAVVLATGFGALGPVAGGL